MPQNRRIDLLILSHRYDITSGAEKSLLELIEYLVSQNKSVHVLIGSDGTINSHLDRLGVSFSVIHNPFWARGGEDKSSFDFTQPWNPTNNTLLTIVDIINELQPRLCVTNTIVTPWLAYAAGITNIPHAWMVHELHSGGLNLRYALGKDQTIKTIDALSDRIFYSSHYTARSYAPLMLHNQEPHIIYPITIKGRVKKTANSPFNGKSSLKIICVGQIKEQKGQKDVIRAATELAKQKIDFELLFVGGVTAEDQDYKANLVELAKKSGIEHMIRFLGHIEKPQLIMGHADIIVTCAVNETFGRMTAEAMSCGSVVIGANSAGTSEIIKDNINGLLYTPGNFKDLAQKIILVSKDESLKERLSDASVQYATNTYSETERFKPFLEYLNLNPTRTSLSLTPLDSVVSDFRTTIKPQKTSRRHKLKQLLKSTKNLFD